MIAVTSDNSQTVFDVALMQYGALEGLAQLLTDNPGLVQVDGTIAQYGVAHLINKALRYPVVQYDLSVKAVSIEDLQTEVYVSSGQQNVFDVALMQYGGVAGLAFLLADNPELIQDNGTVNQYRVTHRIRTTEAVSKNLKPKMLALVPATEGLIAAQQAWITNDGDAWTTEQDEPWTTN